MTTLRAQVCCAWKGTGAARDGYRPAVADDYPPAMVFDVTGTPGCQVPPATNLVIVEGLWDVGTFGAMAADPAYATAVCWADGALPPDDVPPQAELDAVTRAFAASLGLPTAAVAAVLGGAVAGRTRRLIAQQVAAWLRGLTKAA